jgi:hypothetical protein
MIGAARHARGFRRGPILGKFLIDAVAALGRLDPGEANTSGVHTAPIDIALIFGDIDAANLIIRRARKKSVTGDPASATACQQREAEPRQ